MRELDQVVLVDDLPEHALVGGDVGTVVHAHPDGAGFEVEFVTLTGNTVAVVSLAADSVRAIDSHDISHSRQVTGA